MRKSRYQQGSVRKQRGRWMGMWWVDGKRKSRTIGLIKDMTKSEAREVVADIVERLQAERSADRIWRFGEFVNEVYFPFYARKWKRSTRDNNVNRVLVHLVSVFKNRNVASLRREELQDLLDAKAKALSFSVVDRLRWDLKQVFDMAIAEGIVERNPALLLFTPKEAKKPVRRAMTLEEVRCYFAVLNLRERLIVKLAIFAGMRPGEIFALKWGKLTTTYADVTQRIYRGEIDTPKTDNSVRRAALSAGLLQEIEQWRATSLVTLDDAWVFPSERMTPLSKDNCWRRSILPRLQGVGLSWANFLVMRRTHSTLMKTLGVDPKLVADQLGHTLDVNQNVYTQSPVAMRQEALNKLEERLLVM